MQLRRALSPKNRKQRQRSQAETPGENGRNVRHPMSTVRILRSEEELREAVNRAAQSERHLAQQVDGRARRYERINGTEGVMVTSASTPAAEDLTERRMRRSA